MSFDYQQVADKVQRMTGALFDQAGIAELFEYLDDLRESGETNMFGARPYLVQEFELKPNVAGQVLSEWMATFSARAAMADADGGNHA